MNQFQCNSYHLPPKNFIAFPTFATLITSRYVKLILVSLSNHPLA